MTDNQRNLLLLVGAVALYAYHRGYRIMVKDGVVLALAPEMSRALPLIVSAHRDIGIRDPIITSGSEGEHQPGSLHYVGKAIDLRTRDLNSYQIVQLIGSLRAWLGEDYDVLDEGDHIHVEYDPS